MSVKNLSKPYYTCPKCGNKKDFYSLQCIDCYNLVRKPTHVTWSEDEIQFLKSHYSQKGSEWVSSHINKTQTAVLIKANRLKLHVDEDIRRNLVHGAAAKHMRDHNPSKQPGASERLSRQYHANPNIYEKMLAGHAKMRRDKPSGLERKLWGILDNEGVTYETSVELKSKFIVDVKIGNLIIEADGDWWHGHPRFEPLIERQIKQKRRDDSRNKYLAKCGYTTVRIWESDMTVERVKEILKEHGITSSKDEATPAILTAV